MGAEVTGLTSHPVVAPLNADISARSLDDESKS